MTDKQHKEILAAIEDAKQKIISILAILIICVIMLLVTTACSTQKPTTGHKLEYYYNRPVSVEEIDLTKGDVR